MTQSPETRFSLIEKLKSPGDMDAWSEFASIYQPLIVELCLRKGMQHADANDLAQEVLSRVAKNIAKFQYDRPGATFRGWLYRITRNLTVDFFRRRAKDPLKHAIVPEDFQELCDPPMEETREFDLEFQKRMFLVVARAVESTVQQQTWAAFWMVEIQQRTPDEVALELGMTRGAVYVAKSRVIAKLRKEVQGRMNETNSCRLPANNDQLNK